MVKLVWSLYFLTLLFIFLFFQCPHHCVVSALIVYFFFYRVITNNNFHALGLLGMLVK